MVSFHRVKRKMPLTQSAPPARARKESAGQRAPHQPKTTMAAPQTAAATSTARPWRCTRGVHRLVRLACERSPWHRERLRQTPHETLSLSDLSSLPTMTKDDLMANWNEIVTDPRGVNTTTTETVTSTTQPTTVTTKTAVSYTHLRAHET